MGWGDDYRRWNIQRLSDHFNHLRRGLGLDDDGWRLFMGDVAFDWCCRLLDWSGKNIVGNPAHDGFRAVCGKRDAVRNRGALRCGDYLIYLLGDHVLLDLPTSCRLDAHPIQRTNRVLPEALNQPKIQRQLLGERALAPGWIRAAGRHKAGGRTSRFRRAKRFDFVPVAFGDHAGIVNHVNDALRIGPLIQVGLR
jgi:hypothetical protein